MPRSQTLSILFCDLVASTERRARLGDDAFDEFTARLMAALRAAVAEHDGKVVSSAGDGLMVVFPTSAADAIVCATEMHRRVATLDPEDPPKLRIGVSSGEVAVDGDEYAGMPIVEAARLEAAASPGTTLASAVVRSLIGTRRRLHFRSVGTLSLKGIPDPLPTVEVVGEELADGPSRGAPSAATREPPPHRRRTLVIAGVVALAVAVIGVGLLAMRGGSGSSTSSGRGVVAPTGYTPRFVPKDCRPDVRTDAPNATCGDLVVPQDRAHPDRGPDVRIDVIRVPSREGRSGAAPTIDFGAESIATSPVRDHSELIEFGNRGWFGSTPHLTCPTLAAHLPAQLAQPADDPASIAQTTADLRACRTDWVERGYDPRNFNAYVAALDTLDLMVALKLRQVDLIVQQHLSVLGFAMLRRAPGAIRSLTIQSPFPNGKTTMTNPVSDLSAAFTRYVAQCEESAVCRGGYPDLVQAYVQAHEAYAANPTLVEAPHPDEGEAPVPVLLDGQRVAQALTQALGDSETYPLIPAAITGGSDSVIASQVLEHNRAALDPEMAWGAAYSYFCAYDFGTLDQSGSDLAADTAPAFATGELVGYPQWCETWDVPEVPDSMFADAASPVPAFFYRGDLSPRGQAEWIQTVARSFPNSSTLVLQTLGDDIAQSAPPCFAALRRRFLEDPTTKLRTAGCTSPAIAFVAPTN